MEAKKIRPSKPILQMCKLISHVGKVLKKPDSAKPAAVVLAAACAEEVPVVGSVISSPIPVIGAQKFLTIPTVAFAVSEEAPLPSPTSPRIASYPPTPDYIKYSNALKPDLPVFFPSTTVCTGLHCADHVVTADEFDGRDWAITFADLEIGTKVEKNSTGTIYR